MQDTDINVAKRERVATLRQVITPSSQTEVASTLEGIIELYRAEKITGKLQITFNQGGVQNFITEELSRPATAGDAKIFDSLFKNRPLT
jgi:hypothetical protein